VGTIRTPLNVICRGQRELPKAGWRATAASCLALGLAALVLATEARAAQAEMAPAEPAGAGADDLFYQAKSLMEQGQVSAACQKFSESLATQRRGGTLLNLAVCRATQGRYATALGLFQEALELARQDGRLDRQQFALSQIDAARSKLSWLTVTPPPDAARDGLTVRCDGEVLPPELWGQPRAIDAGRHTVSAVVPGAKGFEVTVLVEGPGDKKSVEIPPFAPEPPPVAAVVGAAPPPPVAVAAVPPRRQPSWSSRLVHNRGALALTAATVVLAASWGYFARQTVDASNDVSSSFQPGAEWDSSAQDRGRRNEKLEIASGVGALLTGAAAAWLTFHY
jgi:tetratricopeptide (TPR) repeat protein